MELEGNSIPRCAECGIPIKEKACVSPNGRGPDFCPTLHLTDIVQKALENYKRPGLKEFARMATVQEGECYVNREPDNLHTIFAVKTRVQETIEFANKMNYRRLGLAFCSGLRDEAKILADILKTQGFDVVSVMCAVGRIPKEFLGLREDEKVNIGKFENMCNPITQAQLLNAAKTDFNIMLGLCVGHDSLFFRYVEALTTVLGVKDRVTGHNPIVALHLHRTYYKKLQLETLGKGGDVSVSVRNFET
jgi:uncharacterized metal-binding protein